MVKNEEKFKQLHLDFIHQDVWTNRTEWAEKEWRLRPDCPGQPGKIYGNKISGNMLPKPNEAWRRYMVS